MSGFGAENGSVAPLCLVDPAGLEFRGRTIGLKLGSRCTETCRFVVSVASLIEQAGGAQAYSLVHPGQRACRIQRHGVRECRKGFRQSSGILERGRLDRSETRRGRMMLKSRIGRRYRLVVSSGPICGDGAVEMRVHRAGIVGHQCRPSLISLVMTASPTERIGRCT